MSVQVPRSFRLLEELETGEKSQNLPYNISYGLTNASDASLSSWTGTIPGPQNTKFDGRLIEISIYCSDSYPNAPPQVNFRSKVNLPFVLPDGSINIGQFPLLKNWNPKTTIAAILIEIHNQMQKHGHMPQPPEGATY